MTIPAWLSTARRTHLFWLANVAFWGAVFGAGLIVVKAFAPTLADPVSFVGCRALPGFVISSLLRWLSKHDDLRQRLGISQAGLMVGGPVAGGVLLTLILAAAETLGSESTARLGLAARLVINTATLAIWSALYFGIQLVREGQLHELRAFEAESLASRNELKLLQAQISPHFLFNALNTILACKHDPDAIETVTHSLATYLRFLLRQSEALEPLGREIDALEEYLTIQSYRFGDRLSCRIDCDADIRRIPVLPMMVQPLVENALKYGSADGKNLDVRIRAWREADRLFVEVANTGRWAAPDSAISTGTGLQALRRRLLIHGGPAATLTTGESDGWVRALLTIPLTEEYSDPCPATQEPAAGRKNVEPAR
jgi:hypothetical protein